jgi:hypothetical protein
MFAMLAITSVSDSTNGFNCRIKALYFSVFEIPSGTIISSAMLCSIKNRTTVTDNAILYYKLLFYYFACS